MTSFVTGDNNIQMTCLHTWEAERIEDWSKHQA